MYARSFEFILLVCSNAFFLPDQNRGKVVSILTYLGFQTNFGDPTLKSLPNCAYSELEGLVTCVGKLRSSSWCKKRIRTKNMFSSWRNFISKKKIVKKNQHQKIMFKKIFFVLKNIETIFGVFFLRFFSK